MKHLFRNFAVALGLAMFCTAPYAVFDPVNDDTDLFRNNPNIPSERPNVLIILDNSANWSAGGKSAAEISALANTFSSLDDSFNVGMMIMTQQGAACASSSTNGGYVRFGIRQMTTTNRAALAGVVSAFQDANCAQGGDQGSAAAAGQAMYEAYAYFGAKTSYSGRFQTKRDYAGNPSNTAAGVLPGNPFASAAATVYSSPITDGCAKNYIIYISNGPMDNGDDNPSATLYSGAGGLVPGAARFVLSPDTAGSNYIDEFAYYLATTGVNNLGSNQKVFTYTIEVDASTNTQGLGLTALLKSAATKGNGKYFGVTSANAGSEISAALNSIFQEIQSVNSVFAASTLPVSVNVRGTNLNQLYIGVFRPDAKDQPRWFGNLKAYQLKKDSAGNVFTVDSLLNPAINSSTGFITSTAQSFWTAAALPNATYWSFRSAAQNGVGGDSDSPDGDLVEKGGAAQQIRGLYFGNGINGTPKRPLYTCTQGPNLPTCKTDFSTTPSALSATPFDTSNTDITAAALNLGTRPVSALTAATVKSISALADTRTVSLDNSVLPVTLASITTNSITANVTSLANSVTRTITSITNGAVAKTVALTRPANGTAQGVVTGGHGLTNGQTVWITTSGTAQTQGGTRYDTTGVAITYVNSTTFTYPISNGAEPDNSGLVVNSNTQVNVTTSAAHGFTTGESVTIAGATPTSFNGVKSIVVDTPTTFHYTNTVAPSPTLSSPTAAGATSTVTATLSATAGPGTFGVGQQVTISGGNTATTTPTYSGTFTIASVTTSGGNTTAFTYTTSAAITTAASGGPFTAAQSGTTATATVNTTLFPLGHGFANGATVTISGALPAGFDVQATISTTGPTATTFTYTVASGLGNATANPTLFASTGTSAAVTATLNNHGFSAGNSITIAGAANGNGAFTILTVPDANTFTYTSSSAAAPGGSPTVRLTSNPLAYATIPAHGFGSAGATVSNLTVTGATPAGYNVSNATATVVDTDTISYVLSAAQGTQTGTTLTATAPSTTATATSVAHGFIEGESVTISGATPTAFNMSSGSPATVHVIDLNTFSYTIGSAQLTASGTILAASTSGSTSPQKVIDWIRGEDNFEDENGNTSFSDTRASIHGDVLHSRPAVVNYNRRQDDTTNADNDVYIFYGGNDGLFRAVKGGFGSSTTTTLPSLAANDPSPGVEVWGFVAPEHFPFLSRLRTNSPGISSAYKKPYFFDGPIGAFTLDANGDGMLDAVNARNSVTHAITAPAGGTGDKVWLFLGMRRGGRFIYALDVTDPLTPKMMWRKGCPSLETDTSLIDAATGCDLGWGELGQTWSEPKVVQINCTSSTYNCGSGDPVLMFGAGYDATIEDLYPSTITATTSTTETAAGTTYTRSMGRGIYVVNARTGNIIWQAAGHSRADSSSHAYKQVSGMNYSIPSDIAVVVGDPTPKPFRAYVGDTGGRLWRVDFGDVNPANWTVARLASIADRTTTTTYTDALTGTTSTVIPGLRKFMNAPDVIGSSGFDMVMIGSGDREHPFDSSVINRVYGFKDRNQTSSPFSGSTQIHSSITHPDSFTFNSSTIAALQNVSSQCIELPANCTGTAPEVAFGGGTASQNTSDALNSASNEGWFINLAAGEKQVGATLAPGGGVVQFATNQPSASAGGGSCSPNLGVARQYTINFLDGTAYNGTTLSTQYAGGGFLPSPVLVYVGLGGTTGTGASSTTGVGVGGAISGGTIGIGAGTSTGGSGNVATAVVCYGATCSQAPGSVLFSRLRKFWFKEID